MISCQLHMQFHMNTPKRSFSRMAKTLYAEQEVASKTTLTKLIKGFVHMFSSIIISHSLEVWWVLGHWVLKSRKPWKDIELLLGFAFHLRCKSSKKVHAIWHGRRHQMFTRVIRIRRTTMQISEDKTDMNTMFQHFCKTIGPGGFPQRSPSTRDSSNLG